MFKRTLFLFLALTVFTATTTVMTAAE